MRKRWVRESVTIEKGGRVAKFGDFVKFVTRESDEQGSLYGRRVFAAKPEHKPTGYVKGLREQTKNKNKSSYGFPIVFTWPFLHFSTFPAAVAAKLQFQFKSDLEFKCVSHLGLHLCRPNFPRHPLLSRKKIFCFRKKFFYLFIFFSTPNFVQPKAFERLMLET